MRNRKHHGITLPQAVCALLLTALLGGCNGEDWDFTPEDYEEVSQAISFADDSAWLPQKYKDNLLATLRWALSPDRRPPVTEGINTRDFYHGHVVCPWPCDFSEELRRARDAYFRAEERMSEIGDLTEGNLAQFSEAVRAAEQAASEVLTILCRSSDNCSIIYHTYEYRSPSDGGIRAGDPRRNIKTDFPGNSPAPYSPPDGNDAGSYSRNYCHVFQFAFLIDRNGRIHVTTGSTRELSKVTGRPER